MEGCLQYVLGYLRPAPLHIILKAPLVIMSSHGYGLFVKFEPMVFPDVDAPSNPGRFDLIQIRRWAARIR
jgi:hypothetical protein